MNDQERATLSRLFGVAPGSPEMGACEALHGLARECPSSDKIVYLGAGNGCGVIALAFGSRAGRGNWIAAIDEDGGRGYQFLNNVTEAGVRKYIRWSCAPYRKEARKQCRDVGLIVWDTGRGPRLVPDFAAWERWVIDGGLFAVHGNRIAFSMLVDYAVDSGRWIRGPSFQPADIATLRRFGFDE